MLAAASRIGFSRTSTTVSAADSQAVTAAAAHLCWAQQATSTTPAPSDDDVAGSDPASRHGHTATSIPGGRVLVVGGVNSHSDQGPLRDVHLLDTRTMMWHRGPDCPARTGVCFHSATFVPSGTSSSVPGNEVEGQVVVLGGVGEAPRSMLSCCSLHTQTPCTWSRQEAMQEPAYPEPRQSHSAVLVDQCRIFVCGGVGQHLPSGEAFSDVWIFHLDTLLWLKAEPSGSAFPGRGGHSASLLGRQMLIFGGGVGTSSASHFNDLWAFDVDLHVWVQVQTEPSVPAPLPRSGHVAITIVQPSVAAQQHRSSAEMIADDSATPEQNNGLVPVATLVVMGGQNVAARGYLALSSKQTFHADSWYGDLLLPRSIATSANLKTDTSGASVSSGAGDSGGLLLLPSPTPTHSVGAQLRLCWRGPLVNDPGAHPSSEHGHPTGRSFHRAVVVGAERSTLKSPMTTAEIRGLDILVLGGIGCGGSVGQDDASWTLTVHHNLYRRDDRSACHKPTPTQQHSPRPHVATGDLDIAASTGPVDSADAFLQKLQLEDFFGTESETIGASADHVDASSSSSGDAPPAALESTISASSMEAWPTLSPEKLLPAPDGAVDAGNTGPETTTSTAENGGSARSGAAGGGASVTGQLEAAVQLCAQLRATVATSQQSEAKYRNLVAAREAEIQRIKDAREVDTIRSNQLIEDLEVRARWGGLLLSLQRAMQLYNDQQSIDPQQLLLDDIETILSSVKALKLAEVSRWQTLIRGGTPAVDGSTHRWVCATQQPAAPDLSFLLYESADALPLGEVSRLVKEYERLCAAEMQH